MQYVLSENDRIYRDRSWSNSLGARQIHEDGRPYHTFRTATLLADGDRLLFENCRFENTAGPGAEAGQAIALYLDGDGIVLRNCSIYGHQDTLFLAPLPPKELEKDGFLGPKQFTPRTRRSYLFEGCRIYGGVDFIFGGATALFRDCEFINIEPGYVFAPCTPEDSDTGFTALNCRFLRSSPEEVPDGSTYIARPWREFAKVRLENCFLDAHIAAEGFADWNERKATVRFEEYGSTGPGAGKRPDWISQ